MTQLLCVDPQRVDEVWPHVILGISQALKRGAGGQLFEIEQDLYRGHALLWLAIDGERKKEIRASLITQLVKTDAGLKCKILALSGQRRGDWLNHFPAIEQFARDEGCTSIEFSGRKGWARILPDYEQIAIVMRKEIHGKL